ncbi:DUF1127 domain-containing protein [Marinivivus vitaminiproducens]|uniref:DUF1127 domain-containing protein n=1 Tax=Marinivivus vitaminiproducens TaxID=3035935 RepID=UPI0027A5766A|nr:DUF1127 domain-containing protein [Geminicoccaceae bacterium SCSIO 64248]
MSERIVIFPSVSRQVEASFGPFDLQRHIDRWLEPLLVAMDRYRQRRTLAELDEHMLKDIGISRSEADQEAAKPFWRE